MNEYRNTWPYRLKKYMRIVRRFFLFLRWLTCGRNYAALIGKTRIATHPDFTRITSKQLEMLMAFRVESVTYQQITAQLGYWVVWTSDLYELHVPVRCMLKWVWNRKPYEEE